MAKASGDIGSVSAAERKSRAADDFNDNLKALAASGAQHFLIANAPNPALVPAISQQGPLAQLLAYGASVEYNTDLGDAVDEQSTTFSLDVAKLDVFSLLQSLADNPEQIGLDNVIDACLTPDVIPQAVCTTPEDYLFWDGIHPRKTVHAYLAQQAFERLP